MTTTLIYLLAWVGLTAIGAFVFSAGLLNDLGYLILGLAFSSLALLGPIAVLPVWLEEHHAPKTHPRKIAARS
jgi:hypothetical protein